MRANKVLKCPNCGEIYDYTKAYLHNQCPECGEEMKVIKAPKEVEDEGDDD